MSTARISRAGVLAAGLVLGAEAPALGAQPEPERRRVHLLDSLARVAACPFVPGRPAADWAQWERRHACGVIAHARRLLAASAPDPPHWQRGDADRVQAATVTRIQWCKLPAFPEGAAAGAADRRGHAADPGRRDTVQYYVHLSVPRRPHLLLVRINALTLRGRVGAQDESDPASIRQYPLPGTRRLTTPGAPCG